MSSGFSYPLLLLLVMMEICLLGGAFWWTPPFLTSADPNFTQAAMRLSFSMRHLVSLTGSETGLVLHD